MVALLLGTTAWALDKKDGVYQIGTVEDLTAFATLVNGGENFSGAVLTADINCGNTQVSIGVDAYRYNGTFDGQGHKVTVNLYPTREGENLFGYIGIGGEVRNLIVDGLITTDYKLAAGICGRNQGVVANCVSLVSIYTSVSGDGTHAGIAAVSSGGAIINCLSAVKIEGAVTENCGGIAGWCDTRTTMRNNLVLAEFNIKAVNGSGCISRNSGSIQNDGDNKGHYLQNFYLNKIGSDEGKGKQVTAEQLASGEVCYLLNAGLATPQWTQKQGDAYPMPFPTYGQKVGASEACDCLGRFAEGATPTFTFGGGAASETHTLENGRCTKCGYFDFHAVPRDLDGYYLLSNADDCKWYNWRRYYGCDGVNARMTADIDLGDAPYFTNNDNYCEGDFDGAGHSLTIALTDEPLEVSEVNEYGLKVQPYAAGNNCLFHNLAGSGKVHDLAVHGTIYSTGQFAATITNHLRGDNIVKINRVFSDVDITSNRGGDGTHGGIVGVLENNAIIENVCFAGSITADSYSVGGLVGWSSGVCQLNNALMIATGINVGDGDNWIISRNPSNAQCKNVYYINNYPGAKIPESAKLIEDEATLEDGSITYTFNGDQTVINWTQTLGTDATPIPLKTHKQVYASGSFNCDGTPKGVVSYTNTEGSTKRDPHKYVDGLCSECHAADYDYLKPNAKGEYEIATAAQLINISQVINHKPGMLNAKVVLTADIDAEEHNIDFVNNYANTFGIYKVTRGFEPFGIEGAEFTGTFEGNLHTISNLHIYREGRAVGLLGAVAGTAAGGPVRIDNVVMDETCSIYGGAYVGLIGMSANVSGSDHNTNKVIMNNVGIECKILADGANAGGIIGCCMGSQASFDITNAYTTGDIKGGNESSALTGWFGDHAKVTSCWTTSRVEGFDGWNSADYAASDFSKYFGRFGSAPTLTRCFDPYGKQGGVTKLNMEDVESGKLAWDLNGASFANPTWYQNLNDNDVHPSVSPARGSVYLTDDFYSNTDAEVETAATNLKDWEEKKLGEIDYVNEGILTWYESLISNLSGKTMNELGASYEALLLQRDSLQKNVDAYLEYEAKVLAVDEKLKNELKTLSGAAVDLLKKYLNGASQGPDGNWPNGNAAYILDKCPLLTAGVKEEIVRIDAWLAEAIRTCYGPGADVSDLLANTDFSKQVEGWNCVETDGYVKPSGFKTVVNAEDVTCYAAEGWNCKFDISQTLTNLKPGLYVFTVNGVYRPSDNIYSYNHAATIYANGIHNYIMTAGEDMIQKEDAVNGVNCYIAKFGANESTYDFCYFAEPQSNVEAPNDELDEALGYITRGPIGMAVAGKAGRYLNQVLGIVGEDGTLTVGITNPGTQYGSDGTLMSYCHLYYLGTEAEANLTEVVKSMKDRANSVLNQYNTDLPEDLMPIPSVPIFSTSLKTDLENAAAGGNTVQTAQALSDLFQQIYANKLASRNIYYQYSVLEKVAYMDFQSIPEGVTPLLSPDESLVWEDKSIALSDAYFEGSMSPEEVANLNTTLFNEGFLPAEKDGVWQIANPINMLWFSAAGSTYPSVDAELTGNIDLAGVNFDPIGVDAHRYSGTFNGNGYTISNLYTSKPGAIDVGLFGIVRDATITNFRADNTCYIAGDHFIGLIGGMDSNNMLKLSNVETFATVECDNQNGAGLVGCLRGDSKAQIENCLVGGSISSGNEGGEVSGWLASSSSTYVKNVLSIAQYNSGVVGLLRASDGPTYSNNFNLTGKTEKGSVTKVSTDELADGSVAWRLNGSTSDDPVWFQTLGTDTVPSLFGSTDVIYYYGGKYTNEKPYVALNPFAYQILGASTADGITVTYLLNSPAQKVTVNFLKGGATALSVDGTTVVGTNEVTVTLSEFEAKGLTKGTELAIEIVVDGHKALEPFYVDEIKKFYGARGLAVSNCPGNADFGTVYVAESKTKMGVEGKDDNETEYSNLKNGNGAGIYAFTPAFEPIPAANGKLGFNGGITFGGKELAPKSVRVSEDGRIFISRCDDNEGSSLFEANAANLNEAWTPVFTGGDYDASEGVRYIGDVRQNGKMVNFNVTGTGADLKVITIEADKLGGYWGSQFNLGTAKTWGAAPSAALDSVAIWTNTADNAIIAADGKGGYWMLCGKLYHYAADGKTDYVGTASYPGAGFCVSPDGSQIAFVSGNCLITTGTVSYERNPMGMIAISPKYRFSLKRAGTSVRGIAFDYANNLYAINSDTGIVERWVMPSETAQVTIPAGTFKVGETSTGIESIDGVGPMKDGYIYNVAGQRLNKAQKGINVVNGQKVLMK